MRRVDERIRGDTPAPDNVRETAQLGVAASPVDLTEHVGNTNEFTQIASALHDFNPALNHYLTAVNPQDKKDARTAGAAAGLRADVADPVAALKVPESMPEGIAPAFSRDFQDGYREVVGSAHAARVVTSMREDYLAMRDTEGMTPQKLEGWLQERTRSEFAGITDPLMLVSGSQMIASLAHGIRTDFQNKQREVAVEQANTDFSTAADFHVNEVGTPEALATTIHGTLLPLARKLGIQSTPEAVDSILEKVRVQSQRLGGTPEMFDAFTKASPEGVVPADAGKGMAEKVQRYRQEAQAMRDAAMKGDVQQAKAYHLAWIDEQTRAGKEIDFEKDILPRVGTGNFYSADEGFNLWKTNRDKVQKDRELASAVDLVSKGMGAYVADAPVRKQAADQLVKPVVLALQKAATTPGPDGDAAVAQGMSLLVGIHTKTDELSPTLESAIKQSVSQVPTPGGEIPPMFAALAKGQAVLEQSAPHLASRYFSGDAGTVFQSYNRAVANGTPPKVAYEKAFGAIDPAAKKLAAERAADPAFKAAITSSIHNLFVTGWDQIKASMPGLWGLNQTATGNANSEPHVVAWAEQEAARIGKDNPQLGPDEIAQRAGQAAQNNFVWDPNIKRIMQVPPGRVGPDDQKRFQLWTELVVSDLKSRYGDSVVPLITYKGNDTFQVDDLYSMTQRTYTMADINKVYGAKYEWQTGELAKITDIQKQIDAGTYTPTSGDEQLINKALLIGAMPRERQRKLEAVQEAAKRASLTGRLSTLMDKNAGSGQADYATYDGTDYLKSKPTLDDKAAVAKTFLANGNFGGALTAMGEGVALTAYPDPAHGTGMNIGLGYNMDQNKGTIAEDFRRAGIAPEYVDDIKAGKRSITREQAVRLYEVTAPRYEQVAKNALEAEHPGEWDKLLPHQRAVLSDMAYQLGDRIESFPKALSAFARGDTSAMESEIKTYYKGSAGGMLLAEGRYNLRKMMLANPSSFASLLRYVKS